MSLKVLILHNRYIEKGGEDTTVSNELELLRSRGIDANVYYFDNSGSKLYQLFKFITYPFNIVRFFTVLRLVKHYKPDVVHLHNFFYAASTLSLWALKVSQVPFVVTIQNFRLICPSTTLFNNGHLYLESVSKPFSFKVVFDRVYRNSSVLTFWLYVSNLIHFKLGTFGLPSRYIFASKFSEDVYRKSIYGKYASRFLYKPNFMKVLGEPINYKRDDYFLFIGRLTHEKGINVLIDAFKTNGKRLLVLGDGELRDDVIELATNNNNVEYLGFKNRDDVLSLLKHAKALLFPSIWYEGMPLTIVEAFSVGTPVIASNLGAMAEMIESGKNGFLFEKGSSSDLNSTISALLSMSNFDYRELITSSLQIFLEKYSDEVNFKRLISVYCDVAKEK